jgi:glycosyltransferase involved in cell wall biosynthesis
MLFHGNGVPPEQAESGPSPDVDVIIPVYNEGENIILTLESLRQFLQYRARVLICYDRDDDNTLPAIAGYRAAPLQVVLVRNAGRGVLGAVKTGFAASTAPCVVTMPADDDYNAERLNAMIGACQAGHDVVVASRFMRGGGGLVGCPFLKAAIVQAADWFMCHVARLPTHDASNGFRIFSRRVVDQIPVESAVGFAYSIELLVKAHRLRWPIVEMPVDWHQRKAGQSRFQIVRWLPQYMKWMFYALATTYAGRGAASVKLSDRAASVPPPEVVAHPQATD